MTVYRDGVIVPQYATLAQISSTGYYTSGSTAYFMNVGGAGSGQFTRYSGLSGCVVGSKTQRSFDLLAQSIIVRTTTGAGEAAPIETAANKENYVVLDFDEDTIEYAQVAKIMPEEWDGGSLTAKFVWTATESGAVVWGLQGVSMGDNEAIDSAFGSAVEVTDLIVTSNYVHISQVTPSMTVAGTPVAGEYAMFQMYRKATDGADTLGADARLMGVIITYGV